MYITRIMPTLGIYDLCELTIRTIGENYFVGIDKHDKRARLFSPSDIDSIVFSNRKDALMKIKEAEKMEELFRGQKANYLQQKKSLIHSFSFHLPNGMMH